MVEGGAAENGHRSTPGIDSPLVEEMNVFNAQAASILKSGKAASAFDLTKEPAAVRDRYGRRRCSGRSVGRPADTDGRVA